MADDKIADHTLAQLREIRSALRSQSETLARIDADMASMQKSHGAILWMIGGQHEATNELRKDIGELKVLLQAEADWIIGVVAKAHGWL